MFLTKHLHDPDHITLISVSDKLDLHFGSTINTIKLTCVTLMFKKDIIILEKSITTRQIASF